VVGQYKTILRGFIHHIFSFVFFLCYFVFPFVCLGWWWVNTKPFCAVLSTTFFPLYETLENL